MSVLKQWHYDRRHVGENMEARSSGVADKHGLDYTSRSLRSLSALLESGEIGTLDAEAYLGEVLRRQSPGGEWFAASYGRPFKWIPGVVWRKARKGDLCWVRPRDIFEASSSPDDPDLEQIAMMALKYVEEPSAKTASELGLSPRSPLRSRRPRL